jgi:hypothetical protein
MKILLVYFNAKVGREDVFKPTIGNESLYESSNDNKARVAFFRFTFYIEAKDV